MRITSICILLLISFFYNSIAPATASNMTVSHIEGYWPLNNSLYDLSGNGLSGYLIQDAQHSITQYKTGGYSVWLPNATDDMVQNLRATIEPTGSISIWVYKDNWASAGYYIIFDSADVGGNNRLLMRIQPNNHVLLYMVGGYTDGQLQTTNAFSGSGWHHFVATWATNDLKLYVDGVLDVQDTSVGIPPYSQSSIHFGSSYTGYTTSLYGYLDEIIYFNLPINSTEVEMLTNFEYDFVTMYQGYIGGNTGCSFLSFSDVDWYDVAGYLRVIITWLYDAPGCYVQSIMDYLYAYLYLIFAIPIGIIDGLFTATIEIFTNLYNMVFGIYGIGNNIYLLLNNTIGLLIDSAWTTLIITMVTMIVMMRVWSFVKGISIFGFKLG